MRTLIQHLFTSTGPDDLTVEDYAAQELLSPASTSAWVQV